MSWETPTETVDKLNLFPIRYSVKESNGYLTMVHYDKEKEGKINDKSIEGICVGRNMCSIESYDTSTEKFYSSTLYQRKTDIVSIYGKGKNEFTGSVEEAKSYLRTLNVKPRTRRQYILITSKGFCSVESHISCAMQIERDSDFYNDQWQKFSFIFTPAKYNKSDFPNRDGKPFLPVGADKNPPVYVNIEKGRAISDEMMKQLNVKELFDQYEAFSASISVVPQKEPVSSPEPSETHTSKKEPIDDLPF